MIHFCLSRLEMHLDYSIHPISKKERRVNLIIYMNRCVLKCGSECCLFFVLWQQFFDTSRCFLASASHSHTRAPPTSHHRHQQVRVRVWESCLFVDLRKQFFDTSQCSVVSAWHFQKKSGASYSRYAAALCINSCSLYQHLRARVCVWCVCVCETHISTRYAAALCAFQHVPLLFAKHILFHILFYILFSKKKSPASIASFLKLLLTVHALSIHPYILICS